MVPHHQKLSKLKTYRNRTLVFIAIGLMLLIIMLYVQVSQKFTIHLLFHSRDKTPTLRNLSLSHSGAVRYLIDTPKCKIVQPDLIQSDIVDLFKPQQYLSCSGQKPLLTYIEKDHDIVTLNVNQSAIPLYSQFNIYCCHASITRVQLASKPDDTIKVSDCKEFGASVEITEPIIYVSCTNIFFMEVYNNVHAIISPKFVQKVNSSTKLSPKTTFSILLVGIDSMSKTHLQYSMPKTYNFLEKNRNFVNMKGFVKIGLNTLSNLLGMLAGLNLKQIKECPYLDYIDKCDNIWKIFRQRGYVTAYAEDEPSISSFNFEKKGFHVPPTDLYFRPYMLAAESLGVVSGKAMSYCAGPENEAERIMKLARDFQVAFKDSPKFGLFWMNSFSHDDFNMPSSMDEKVEEFLEEITLHLDDTILFFFSDHGMRFGKVRQTATGWLEERIPFSYLYLPESFEKRFQKEYSNVFINSGRLTNPYDMYMTLQDILFFADKTYMIKRGPACPLCQSLFQEISPERTCEDAAIDKEWCVCEASAQINLTESLRDVLADSVIDRINTIVENDVHGHRCSVYELADVKYVRVAESGHVIVGVETYPRAIFEGIFLAGNGSSELIANPDRIDSHSRNSQCVQSAWFKLYCYCK